MRGGLLAFFVSLALSACGSNSEPSDAGSAGSGASGGTSGGTSGGAGGSGASAGGAAGLNSGGSAGVTGGAGGGTANPTLLRVHYRTDSSHSIRLRGEGASLNWDTSTTMTEGSDGVWEYRFEGLGGEVQFKPVLEADTGDLTWPKGASFSNWRLEPGETLDVFPFFLTDQGQLDTFQVSHPDGPRDVIVYLPPSYDEPGAADKTYPVLILQDGQNLFDESAFFGGWRLQGSLDALFSAGQVISPSAGQVSWEGGSAQEVIVAGVFNAGTNRLIEYTPTNASFPGCDTTQVTCGGGADDYLMFVLNTVAPELRGRYRVKSSRMGFGGSSLGGLLALQACWTHSESFDRCFVHSPSLWWDSEWALTTLVPGAQPGDPLRLYLDAGTESDGLDLVRQLNGDLRAHGFTTETNLWCLEGNGMAHNELAWAERAPWALYLGYADPQRVQPRVSLPSSLQSCQ